MRWPWNRTKKPHPIEYTDVTIFNGKGFLPVQGKSNIIGWVQMEPVVTCDLTPEALGEALEEMVQRGNPPVRHPTEAEIRQPMPLSKATGLRSWKQLAKAGAMDAAISWKREESKIQVAFSPRGAKHDLAADYSNLKFFPIETPMQVIAEYILEEWDDRRAARTHPGHAGVERRT